MQKPWRLAVLSLFFVIACTPVSSPTVLSSPKPTPTETPFDTPPPPVSTATPIILDETLLKADVGELFMVSMAGDVISSEYEALFKDYSVGGAFIFSSNFSGASALARWSSTLEGISAKYCYTTPLLIGIDQEGGQVTSLPDNSAPIAQYDLGFKGKKAVYNAQLKSATRMRSLGVNLVMSPVADLRTNFQDNVIGDRSFGSNADTVAPLVAASVQGLHAGGVGSVVKHFPGLGGAPGNPHFILGRDTVSLPTWENTTKKSFAAGIASGSDVVMTTAVLTPNLSKDTLPALLSPNVVTKLLREELNFDGVIMTDSLSMGGLQDIYPLTISPAMALKAGNDMILLGSDDPALERVAIESVMAAVRKGDLSMEEIHAKAERIRALARKIGSPVVCTH